jgi:hypothetical protein
VIKKKELLALCNCFSAFFRLLIRQVQDAAMKLQRQAEHSGNKAKGINSPNHKMK